MDSKFVIIVLLFVFAVILTIAYRELTIKSKKNGKLIFGSRERLENKMYDISELATNRIETLFDTTRLIFPTESSQLTIGGISVRNDSFFTNMGIANLAQMTTVPHMIATLMPFNNRFNARYGVIKSVCSEYGFICRRSDEDIQTGSLIRQIVDLILRAQLVIAVIDGKNPNVFYEIGIAHALGKPVVLIANMVEVSNLPFNISSDRLLLYSNLDDLNSKLSKILKTLNYA